MPQPLISVIVAVRNAQSTIAQTLSSLANQSLREFETILIDGASTDDTLKEAEKFEKIISTTISEPDSGIADAWNKGVRHASGKWIIFLNAGDLLHPDHFKRAYPYLNSASSRSIIFCDVVKFNDKNEVVAKINGTYPTNKAIQRGGIGFPHPGSFSSNACFIEIGPFDTTLSIAIDTDWLLRCYKAGVDFQKFDSCAYMATGGISDRKFGKAMREYFLCACRLDLASNQRAKLLVLFLPIIRKILHINRQFGLIHIRTAKHILVSIANTIANLIPFHTSRRLYFKALQFNLGKMASIGKGFEFYRVGNLTIGENSVINRNCLFDNRDKITIGENVSIARNVRIFTAGHDIDSPYFEMHTSPVKIENHVVIFSGATIMPGVVIGTGAVVLGGAVVTKDVAPLEIVGGVPAKSIKKRRSNPVYKLNYPYPLAM